MTVISPTKSRLDLLKRHLDAFNLSDWETYQTTLTPDSIHLDPGSPEVRGPEAIVEAVNVFKIEGVAEIVWKGTHTGQLATPSGPISGAAVHSRWHRVRF